MVTQGYFHLFIKRVTPDRSLGLLDQINMTDDEKQVIALYYL